MYWNIWTYNISAAALAININMRCIEIEQYLLQKMEHKGLTLTWDVLKYNKLQFRRVFKRININMRCIEIFPLNHKQKRNVININMRCIEMQRKLRYPLWDLRLTLTWDVLKYIFSISVLWLYGININMRCIEMKTGAPNNRVSIWININMRCIEIGEYDKETNMQDKD